MDRTLLILTALLFAATAIAEEKSPRVPLSTARANAEGNKKLEEGLYEDAAALFRGEALRMPENGILQRNLAGALARAGLGEEALASYGQALRFAEGRKEQAKVYYDLANTLTLGGEFEAALDQYTRALMLTPEDMDIKHNMEFLQRMMQEQEQQQEQQEQSENSDENQEQKENENQNENSDQNQNQQQDQEQQQQDQSQQGEQEEQEQPQPQSSEEEQTMSEEDAQRLLDAMMEEEREFQEMRARQEIEEKDNVEKDW
ncbi:tetratricopeptide repeat protein [bacterium]|nr:tetratricopeptide repeat protein [bacterium]